MTVLDNEVAASIRAKGYATKLVTPVSPASDWVEIHSDCSNAVTDNEDPVPELNGNTDVKLLSMGNAGTMVLIRCIYDSGDSLPTVRVYGFDNAHRRQEKSSVNANPMFLRDEDGNLDIAFTAAPTTDIIREDNRIATDPVKVDALGSTEIAVLVTVGNAGSADVRIEAKVL